MWSQIVGLVRRSSHVHRPPRTAPELGAVLDRVLDRNNHSIEIADAKAAVIIFYFVGIAGLLTPLAASSTRSVTLSLVDEASFEHVARFFGLALPIAAFLATSLVSIIRAIRALTPVFMFRQPPSHTFFGDIAKQDFPKWRAQLLGLDERAINDDLAWQVYETSRIATTKHRNIQYSIQWLLRSMFFGLVVYLISHELV